MRYLTLNCLISASLKALLGFTTSEIAYTIVRTVAQEIRNKFKTPVQTLRSPESQQFLLNSISYEQLLGRIRTGMILTPKRPSSMTPISERICARLSARLLGTESDADALRHQEASFEVEWNPRDFLSKEPVQKLSEVTVLVGDQADAQATTCKEYINQIWPATGIHTLKAIQSALENSEERYEGKIHVAANYRPSD
jgi:hypothetical protein